MTWQIGKTTEQLDKMTKKIDMELVLDPDTTPWHQGHPPSL